MDFFAQQDAARRSGTRLLLAMAVAVVAVVAAVDLAVLVCFGLWGHAGHPGLEAPTAAELQHRMVAPALLWASIGTVVVILGGALIAWMGLSGGGRAVAESLGGREIQRTTQDPDERRLLNVVEEMALASGVPCPPVFAIDDPGINAFAAGHSTADAAIGVTRGAVAQLPRDELQGVIAHEFSHILNGDMRLNMRLIAVVAGLVAVASVGRGIFRVACNSGGGRGRKSNPLPLIAFGAALMAIGGLGWIAGRLIQSAFSRSREFLADASAVQFTRNPEGIAGALSRIAGRGSAVGSPRSASLAHLFFAEALRSSISGLFATHPPLEVRIARIRGLPVETVEVAAAAGAPAAIGPAMGFAGGGGRPAAAPAAGPAAPRVAASAVVASAGSVSPERVRFGAALLARLPAALAQAAREPASARAAVLVTLLHRDPAAADRQVALVHACDPWLASELRRLQPLWNGIDADAARLPLIQLAAPALGSMSPRQRESLLRLAERLAHEDGVLTLREFCVLRRLNLTLELNPAPRGRTRLVGLRGEAAVLIGILARAAGGEGARRQAFAAGWARLPLPGAAPAPPGDADLGPVAIGQALDRAATLDPAGARALVDAGAHAIAADGTVNAREAELLRLLADALEVPLPPFADQS